MPHEDGQGSVHRESQLTLEATLEARPEPGIKVLLVEDDEEDAVLVREWLEDAEGDAFALDWAPTYEEALEAINDREHDVWVLDYRLGARTGLDLINESVDPKRPVPIIMLTGQGDKEVQAAADRAGVASYLEKQDLDGLRLAQSIRNALGPVAEAAAPALGAVLYKSDVGFWIELRGESKEWWVAAHMVERDGLLVIAELRVFPRRLAAFEPSWNPADRVPTYGITSALLRRLKLGKAMAAISEVWEMGRPAREASDEVDKPAP